MFLSPFSFFVHELERLRQTEECFPHTQLTKQPRNEITCDRTYNNPANYRSNLTLDKTYRSLEKKRGEKEKTCTIPRVSITGTMKDQTSREKVYSRHDDLGA
ncbi:unnamed protein product [Xylocopa violacea]|uniref:Uncharacterized protein n=1 Tax=Xylocopa violacea TaxID=135666 RepID=A0ABP1NAY7_XYLVO